MQFVISAIIAPFMVFLLPYEFEDMSMRTVLMKVAPSFELLYSSCASSSGGVAFWWSMNENVKDVSVVYRGGVFEDGTIGRLCPDLAVCFRDQLEQVDCSETVDVDCLYADQVVRDFF